MRNLLKSVAAAFCGLALSCAAGAAEAQSNVQRTWTTFVIHGVSIPDEERVAAPGQPLLVQPVTATRAARLEAEAPSLLGMGSAKTFPAGTRMFGVKVPDGWIYCAVAESTVKWLFADWTACYQDSDGDGKFEIVRDSGTPFNGIPLFVFQPGPPKKLPAPIPYTAIPYQDGPRVEIGLVWKPIVMKAGRDQPPIPVTQATITESIITPEKSEGVSRGKTVDITGAAPETVAVNGAVVTVLGMTPEGGLRYRVRRTMPAQIEPLEMVLTTSTYYYVVSY